MAVAEFLGYTAIIFNVKFGNPQLVINADTKICGIMVTESRVVVVGNGEIVTWELPTGDFFPNVQNNIGKSLQITKFKHSASLSNLCVSVSPDLNYVAFGNTLCKGLSIYSTHTGKKLAAVESDGWLPGFTLDGKGVWCAGGCKVDKWAIFEDDKSDIKLEKLESTKGSLSSNLYSSYGYHVTDDGWVLSPSGEHLLWLPH